MKAAEDVVLMNRTALKYEGGKHYQHAQTLQTKNTPTSGFSNPAQQCGAA